MDAARETGSTQWASRELLGLIGLAALFLLPAIRTGYYAEDIIHSAIPGIARLERIPTINFFRDWIVGSVQAGRFYPVTEVLLVGLHSSVSDVFTYKLIIVAATIFDLLLFYLLVQRLTKNAGFAGFAACVALATIQFRIHPDPVLGYYLQVQLVAAGLFFSLLALLLFLEGRGAVWLVLACASYLLILLTYEITYPFFLMHLLLIWRGRTSWRGRLMAALPIVGGVGACVVTTLVVRRLFPHDEYYFHHLDMQPVAYLRAVALQVSAALPLSYFLFERFGVFPGLQSPLAFWQWVAGPRTLVIAIGTLVLAFQSLRTSGRPHRVPGEEERSGDVWGPSALGLGVLLLVLPTLLIAMSPFHQNEFHLGVGWVPVLIQCHGTGLLLATLVWRAVSSGMCGRRFSRTKCALSAVVLALLTAVTYRANEDVAISLNAPVGHPRFRQRAADLGGAIGSHRQLLTAALSAGLADHVPERSQVLLDEWHHYFQETPIHCLYLYAAHASKVLIPVVPEAQDQTSEAHRELQEFLTSRGIAVRAGSPYRLREVCHSERSGFVVLWQAESDAPDSTPKADEEIRFFVKTPGLFQDGAASAFCLIGDLEAAMGKAKGFCYRLRGKEVTVIKSGRDWGLFSLRVRNEAINPQTARVMLDQSVLRR